MTDLFSGALKWPDDLTPLVIPSTWTLVRKTYDGLQFMHDSRMTVIMSLATELDGKRWLHVSFARRSRLPSYEDMTAVKNLFIGADRKAIQVHPARSEHVNIHPNCLHLWSCLDGDPLPDFTHGMGTL